MRKIVFVFLAVMLLPFAPVAAQAGEMDILLQKLVEKGILTAAEAQQVKIETQEQVKKEVATGKSLSSPTWVQNTKMGGDFRLRYQANFPKVGSDLSNVRNRGRIRLRLGVESKVNEKIKIGAGLATGLNTYSGTSGNDAIDSVRSTNQSFSDSFAKKPISLDYAFLQYNYAPWGVATFGKIKNPLWLPTDLVWDTDINPEGGSFNFQKSFNPKMNMFFNSFVGVLDEITSDGDDPMMYVVQPGFSYKLTDRIGLKGAVSQYVFMNIKGRTLDASASTNTKVSGGSLLRYGYSPINPQMEISINEPFKGVGLEKLGIDVPYLSLFGEYVNNLALAHNQGSKNANGFASGFRIGQQKVEGWGQWQFKYVFAMLQKDAIPDILPDSDRYSGKTGIRSHEGELTFGLGKNTSLGIDVYRSWIIGAKSAQLPETIAQIDWNLKF